jgi:hypothetical protein
MLTVLSELHWVRNKPVLVEVIPKHDKLGPPAKSFEFSPDPDFQELIRCMEQVQAHITVEFVALGLAHKISCPMPCIYMHASRIRLICGIWKTTHSTGTDHQCFTLLNELELLARCHFGEAVLDCDEVGSHTDGRAVRWPNLKIMYQPG